MTTRSYELCPGHGLRIDKTDIWMLLEIVDDGRAAVFKDPWGEDVTLRQGIWDRIAPGFRISVQPSSTPGQITLLVEHYLPIILRHPPRDHRKPRPGKGA